MKPLAFGNADLATESLEAAYAIFAPIGHQYQAMLVAQALAEVTINAVWADTARMHSVAYPGSPLTTQVAESAKAGDPALEGHIAEIYAAFNVATGSGLREEALRRGIA